MMRQRTHAERPEPDVGGAQAACSCVLALAILALFSLPHLGATPSLDLSGTWAEWQILSEFATLPLAGDVVRTSTVTMRVTIEQTGSSVALRWTFCASVIDNGSPIASTIIPEAFLASLGEVAAIATLDATSGPVRFSQPWTLEIRGAQLANAETDPLPTSPDDPRVVDQDGDGKPGLTVQVSALGLLTGEVYVVQRVRTKLAGIVVSPDRIEGLVEWTTEQVTLAATDPIFMSELPSRPDPIAENSAFLFVRIDPTWTCTEILDRQSLLLFGGG